MKRASIWDIRDLRGGPSSPRKAAPAVGPPAAPIGSPRLARPPHAARLSTIGRFALRDGTYSSGHVAPHPAAFGCQVPPAYAPAVPLAPGQVHPGHAAAMVSQAAPLPPSMTQAPSSAPPVTDAASRAWVGRLVRAVPDSVDRLKAEPPRSARGTYRSASAPRSYSSGPCGRSGSIPRSRYCRPGPPASHAGCDGHHHGASAPGINMTHRPASSLDCPSGPPEHEARRTPAEGRASVSGRERASMVASPVPVAMRDAQYPDGAACAGVSACGGGSMPSSVYVPGVSRNSFVAPSLDGQPPETHELHPPRHSFTDSIESLLAGQFNPGHQIGSPRAKISERFQNVSRGVYPASPSGVAQSHSPAGMAGYTQRLSSPSVAYQNGASASNASPVRESVAASGYHQNHAYTNGDHRSIPSPGRSEGHALGMVPYSEPTADGEADDSAMCGLGVVQPKGRAQFLREMEGRLETVASSQGQAPPQAQRIGLGGRPPRAPAGPSTSSAGGFRPSAPVPAGAQGSADASGEQEWSTLSDASKQAVRQWAAGQLGGRHCMLVLEQSSCVDTASSLLGRDASMFHLRDGAALNVLSGLQADLGLIGGQEGGFLFDKLFSKPPDQVLTEALSAALEEVGDERCSQASDLTAEQANLALRRRVMKVQFDVSANLMDAAVGSKSPRNGDEVTCMQVWLELVRLYAECGWAAFSSGGGATGSTAGASKEKPKAERPAGAWSDGGVLKELGKEELDLETESQQMGLDALRSQNRAIEEYVIRLVRRRDDLRQIIKLAEERDSYFILGLDGPSATEEEVKKAYRNLARKEHPDKAGIGNKRRFQQIQQAYTAVLRQKKEVAIGLVDGGSDVLPDNAAGDSANKRSLGASVMEAHGYAQQAKECADQVAACAHRTLRASDEGQEIQNAPKRRALGVLRELTRGGTDELRRASGQLRVLGSAICGVATCAEVAMSEQREYTSQTVAGIGLRDRAVIVEDAGRSALASAELLEKIAEATEATLRKVEKASPAPAAGESVGSSSSRSRTAVGAYGGSGGDETASLLRLGVRLLTESLSRTSAVAKRAAEEAIGGATKAFELGRGLVALDVEARKEREKKKAKENSFDEDTPMPAGDVERDAGEAGSAGRPTSKDGREKDKEEPTPSKTPRGNNGQASPRDQLKCAAKRVKERHVALRVKNLRFLTSLNEEALKMQEKLWSMLERSKGALLPEISMSQKGRLFDLVAQLLDFSVVECTRLSANPQLPAMRILEKTLSFALALEHAKMIAMPSDSRTQALKLAALIDVDLLCQIIDGPFKKRLLVTGAKRRIPADRALASGSNFTQGYGSSAARRGSLARGGDSNSQQALANSKPWDEAAHLCCGRIVQGLRRVVVLDAKPDESTADADAEL